ncbi:MAG: hypothetical protein COB96_05390, partial [Planctomycetota bacterium]
MQAVFAAHDLVAEAGRGVAPLLDGLMLVVASSAIVGRAQACHRAWSARSIGGRSGIGGGNSTVGDQVASEAIHPEASSMPLTLGHAARGLVFRRFYTVSPVTQPTHATFLTGMQPWDHGITRNGMVFSERLPSVVETFQREGFETRAVVASFPLAERFGFARGFDAFSDDFSHKINQNKLVWEDHWKIEAGEFFALGDSITDRA